MSDDVVRSVAELGELADADRLEGRLVEDVDLSRTGLAGVRTADVTFRRIALHDGDARRSELVRTRFTGCSLRGARFDEADFRGCSFFSSELIEAGFGGTTASGSSFFSSRLHNADFSGSRLQSAMFRSCELFGVRFARSLLLNTGFDAEERGNVTLDRADFSNAILVDCDLFGANLFGANFDNALLVKVDLRHANLAEASFRGAQLIDVSLDPSQLEPAQREAVEAARLDEPWRHHGFMREVLAAYSPEELQLLLEYLMRTYVIQQAELQAAVGSFATLMSQLKATYDFAELDDMRVRGASVEVRHGREWHELGASTGANAPAPEPAPASGGGRPEPEPMTPSEGPSRGPSRDTGPEPLRPGEDEAAASGEAGRKGDEERDPGDVRRSNRFRTLELD